MVKKQGENLKKSGKKNIQTHYCMEFIQKISVSPSPKSNVLSILLRYCCRISRKQIQENCSFIQFISAIYLILSICNIHLISSSCCFCTLLQTYYETKIKKIVIIIITRLVHFAVIILSMFYFYLCLKIQIKFYFQQFFFLQKRKKQKKE